MLATVALLPFHICLLLPQTCPDAEAFKDALHQYFTDIQKEQAWVETNGAEAMSAVLELVRRHKVGSSANALHPLIYEPLGKH